MTAVPPEHPTDPSASSVTSPTTTVPGTWLPVGLFALAAGLAVNSAIGPLGVDLVDYPLTETLRNQTIGLDAATMFLVAPVAVGAGLLLRRRHCLGPILAVVVGSYTAYMYLQFVVGPDYTHYPGTLPLQMGLFIIGGAVAIQGWELAGQAGPRPLAPRARSRHSIALFALAGFVILRYLPAIPAAFANETIPEGSLGDPAMFWSIFLMDLGVFVPVVLATAVGLRRGSQWALRSLYLVVGWFVLVSLAVLAMSVVLVVNDDPYATSAQIALFGVAATVVVAYAAHLLRPLIFDNTSHPGAAEPDDDIAQARRS